MPTVASLAQAPRPAPSASIEIVRCDRSQDARWNRFVQSSPRGSLYHRAEWRAVNEGALGHATAYLAATDGERVVGVLPIVRVKSLLFGNIACSMPFVNYGGPCGETDAIEARLLAAAQAVAEEWRVDYLEIRSRRRLGEYSPCSEHKVSMTVDLDPDPQALFKRFASSHRGEIKRAYNHGFTARTGHALVDDFYAVLSDNWRDRGTPIYGRGYFLAILRAMPDAMRVTVVYARDGRPAAAAFCGVHNDVVEGMWLGIRADYRRQLAGYVLYWELLKDACLGNHRTFHLGRSSKDSGGEQFKRKWNADAVQLYWHYVLRTRSTIPELNPTNAKLQLAIKTWRKLPVPVTQVIGPMVARVIP
jgi:FemAB-related protein (PEP-CTERM system-associated)